MAANLMVAMLQGTDLSNVPWLKACVILIAIAMVVQAVVIGMAGLAAMKTQKKLGAVADELRAAALPFIAETRTAIGKSDWLIDDISPSIRTITANVEKASANVVVATETVKAKAREIDELTSEVKQRTQAQVRRVDGMVTTGLTAVGEITSSVHQALLGPIREIRGVMNGVKAGLETLLGRARKFGFPAAREGYAETHREDDTRIV